ncbi:hypothetical protein BJF90_17455 [Pseudonocardia sp. CNS-004]|nr:hypothetical protein BJF90_17455 [Pseudonocardia sp. CNS-004]
MVLEPEADSDTERWTCPTCGRVMVVRWFPEFEHVIVRAGDEQAIHTGGKGGAEVGSVAVVAEEGERERAHREWLAENGIAWDGPAA